MVRVYGPNAAESLLCQQSLAAALRDAGHRDEGIRLQHDTVDRLETAGAELPQLLFSALALATHIGEAGDRVAALTRCHEIAEQASAALGLTMPTRVGPAAAWSVFDG